MTLTCFKAYDIRGRLGTDLDAAIAYRIGRGFARTLGAEAPASSDQASSDQASSEGADAGKTGARIVLGRDIRASSEELAAAVARGLMDEGAEVLDLGLCGTEEMYFATTHFGADGGIEVTASHNPMDYNGMKMVRRGSAPLDSATGLQAIHDLALADAFGPARPGGRRSDVAAEARAAYVAGVLGFADVTALKPLKIVVNAGNGAAGPTFDAIAAALAERGAPLDFIRLHHEPDGSFPNGIPNPLLPENRPVTAAAVRAHGADLGLAWDGDFDRCFFFDAAGEFIDGEYIVGLLAEVFLAKETGARIVHDPRIIWNTQDVVARAGGTAIQSRTGHAFIKQALRDHDAVYGGEMSAHHYFRDFVCCDSGMVPWLLVAELMGRRDAPLAALVAERQAAFPSSGEINFRLEDPKAAIARVIAAYESQNPLRDETDGIGMSFGDWRFNLRSSNTEPVVRLNVESRGDAALVAARVAEIRALLTGPEQDGPEQDGTENEGAKDEATAGGSETTGSGAAMA